jgi:hypothetical protein
MYLPNTNRLPFSLSTVAECFPRVRFDDLLAAVNATNDFSRFVQGMRLRFRALVVKV